jgi:hypothetical protein
MTNQNAGMMQINQTRNVLKKESIAWETQLAEYMDPESGQVWGVNLVASVQNGVSSNQNHLVT